MRDVLDEWVAALLPSVIFITGPSWGFCIFKDLDYQHVVLMYSDKAHNCKPALLICKGNQIIIYVTKLQFALNKQDVYY